MIHIDKITIAVENIKKVANFYSKTFNIQLKEIDCGEFSMYAGKMGNIQILFCPKSIAGITATENTIQIRIVVENIDETIDKGIQSGGEQINDIQVNNGVKVSALRDPDGNSIEIIQKI